MRDRLIKSGKVGIVSYLLFSIILTLILLCLPHEVVAQQLNLDFGGGGGSTTSRVVQLILLITILSVAPAILVTVTSFTRIVIVLSFLRQAMGTQTAPPNMVMVSLALFLTGFVMSPTLDACYQQGIKPLMENKIDEIEAIQRTIKPLHNFMSHQVRDKDLQLFFDLSHTPMVEKIEDTPIKIMIPAFMISELRRSFEIGFLIYLPFLIIDMLVASILMSMGMMMLPPATFSLPFKLIFFVLVDGWYLVAGSLVQSFGTS